MAYSDATNGRQVVQDGHQQYSFREHHDTLVDHYWRATPNITCTQPGIRGKHDILSVCGGRDRFPSERYYEGNPSAAIQHQRTSDGHVAVRYRSLLGMSCLRCRVSCTVI